MSVMQRRLLSAAVVLAFAALATPCHAAASTSQTRYVRDRFGNLTAAVVTIQTDHSAWRFVLPAKLLDAPVAAQVDRLDKQFNLGADKDLVSQLLTSLQTSRQQQAVQNNLDRISQINQQIQQQQDQINQQIQPPFVPPPPFIPPPPLPPMLP